MRDATKYWVCGQQNYWVKNGDEAENYAKEVVISDMEEAGDEDVIRKVQGDLGSLASGAEIPTKLNEALTQAKTELAAK